jgi:hypothetical protein
MACIPYRKFVSIRFLFIAERREDRTPFGSRSALRYAPPLVFRAEIASSLRSHASTAVASLR